MVKEQFDFSFVFSIFPKLLQALPITLSIFVIATLVGCLVGLLLTFGKISKLRILRILINDLTILLRGIPTVVLIYLVYFGIPAIVQSITGYDLSVWAKQNFVMIALSIEFAIICSEMFRSAYNSLDKGQLEAAHALGMTKVQRFFRIILPQGIYVILPNMASAILGLIQSTSLAYVLGVMDVMGMARVMDMNEFNMKTFEAYFAVALIYWGLSILVTKLFQLLEVRFGRGQRTVSTAQS